MKNKIILSFLLGCSLVSAQKVEKLKLENFPEDLQKDYVSPGDIDKTIPFSKGEKLEFKLGWGIFSVARAELSTKSEAYEGRAAFRIDLKTETNNFADAFYKVRNYTTSFVAKNLSRSFRYTALQNEGKKERNREFVFSLIDNEVQYIDLLSDEPPRDPVAILPGAFDPLGIVFFVRSLDFKVGDRIIIPTTNGKEFFLTIVNVKEIVRRKFSYGGWQDAYLLEPDIKDVGGVFKRSPDGSIRFFFSTDGRKLPLRMESEVSVGKFWAELTEIGEN